MSAHCQIPVAFGTPIIAAKQASFMAFRTCDIKYKKFASDFTKAKIVDKQNNTFEFMFITPDSSNELLADLSRNWRYDCLIPCFVATPTVLYLIKKSHIHHQIWWQKSIDDYHFLKERAGIPTQSELEFFKHGI
jgi:hypothetical protein